MRGEDQHRDGCTYLTTRATLSGLNGFSSLPALVSRRMPALAPSFTFSMTLPLRSMASSPHGEPRGPL
jgi:hypothetical protein